MYYLVHLLDEEKCFNSSLSRPLNPGLSMPVIEKRKVPFVLSLFRDEFSDLNINGLTIERFLPTEAILICSISDLRLIPILESFKSVKKVERYKDVD